MYPGRECNGLAAKLRSRREPVERAERHADTRVRQNVLVPETRDPTARARRRSGRALRARLRDYLNFEKIRKRARVHQALRLYYEVTYVRYAFGPAIGTQLEDFETALHGFFYPFAADRDFPGEIKAGRKAW